MTEFPNQSKMESPSELSFLPFDPWLLLQRVQGDFPKLVSKRIDLSLQTHPTLACIRQAGQSALILIHSVLNHPETPEKLIDFVFRHELLHIEIPPREVDGHWTSHPPEFWDALRALAPESELAWSWVIIVLGRCLKSDKKRECTFVKSNWKSLMRGGRPTMAQIDTMLNSGTLTRAKNDEPLL
jgi:hypothetical protein